MWRLSPLKAFLFCLIIFSAVLMLLLWTYQTLSLIKDEYCNVNIAFRIQTVYPTVILEPHTTLGNCYGLGSYCIANRQVNKAYSQRLLHCYHLSWPSVGLHVCERHNTTREFTHSLYNDMVKRSHPDKGLEKDGAAFIAANEARNLFKYEERRGRIKYGGDVHLPGIPECQSISPPILQLHYFSWLRNHWRGKNLQNGFLPAFIIYLYTCRDHIFSYPYKSHGRVRPHLYQQARIRFLYFPPLFLRPIVEILWSSIQFRWIRSKVSTEKIINHDRPENGHSSGSDQATSVKSLPAVPVRQTARRRYYMATVIPNKTHLTALSSKPSGESEIVFYTHYGSLDPEAMRLLEDRSREQNEKVVARAQIAGRHDRLISNETAFCLATDGTTEDGSSFPASCLGASYPCPV